MTNTRTRWTDEELENLVYMHKKGMSPEFMARLLGRTDSAIYNMLYRLGHTKKQQKEPEQLTLEPTPKKKEKVVKQEPTLIMKKQELYVLVRYTRPSWLERVRCYLNGTSWKPADKLVKEK
jgi:IS30 family transposase